MTPTHPASERHFASKAVAFGFFVVLALTFLAFVGNAQAGIESPPPPQIWSDKADYAPGETVVLSGANWAPGDIVHIRVNDDAGQTWSRDVDVTADASGAISDQFNLPDWFVANYTVTATGATGTATTSFTDGNVKFDVAPTATTAQFVETLYTAATNCTGAVKSGYPKTLNGSNGDTVGVGSNESLRLDAAATSDQGGAFSAWSTTNGAAFTTIAGTNGKSICITGFQSGNPQLLTIYAAPPPANAAPVANAQSVSTNEDTAKTITLGGSDADGNNLTFALVSGPTNGTLGSIGSVTCMGTVPKSCSADVVYTPAVNYNGPDSFTFKVNDGALNSANATVSITVNAVNDAPTCTNGSATTDEDTPKAITLSCADVENNSLTYLIVSGPTHGSLSGTGANRTYTPDANFNGSDSFTFKANDGADSNVATFNLTVTAVNDAPTCTNGSATTPEDASKAITLSCADVDADSLTYSIVSGPTHGSLSGSGSSRTYSPDLNYNGPDSFTFKVSDGSLDSNVATFDLTVTPVNDAPVATAQSVSTNEDTAKAITLAGTDVDGDALTFKVTTLPANGKLYAGTVATGHLIGAGELPYSLGAGNSLVTYDPNLNFNGSNSFKFVARDASVDSAEATVSITVDSVNDAPTCSDGSETTDEDTPVDITLSCADVDGNSLTYSIETDPAHGDLSGSGASRTYTPDANFNGSDSFTFSANDGTVGSNVATFDLTVTAVNDAPTCSDGSETTDEDTPVDITLSCADVDGNSLTYSIETDPAHGDLSGSGASRTYTPDANFNGSDSFTFSANDGTVDSNVATFNLTVTAVDDPPTVTRDEASVTVDEGDTAANSGTYGDVDGDTVTLSASVGTVTDNGDGTWSWSFDTSDGPDESQTVTITASDGTTGDEAEATFDLTVKNVAPSATFNAPADVDEGSDINVSLSDVVDPGTADTHEYRFKCGDGDWTAYGASASHACPTTDNGTVVVKGQVRDDDGGESVVYSADVTVKNVAPSATFNAPADVDEGSDINVSLSDVVDPGTADTHEYRFKCGDGDWTAYGASASHACPTTDNGTVVVKGQVRDDDGGESVVYSADVTVKNVAPSVEFTSAPTTADEGDTKTYQYTYSDPGADTISFATGYPSCGDHGTLVGSPSISSPGSFQCTFPDGPQTTNVAIRVTDGTDASADVQTVNIVEVQIANVAPTATLANNGPVDEGSAVSVSFSGQSDPSTGDTAAGFHYAYACDNSSLSSATYAGSGTAASKSCTFGDNGSKTVRARIIDQNDGYTEYQTAVTVRNVDPTASNASFTLDPVLGTATAGFDFSDVGWLDTHGPNLSFFTWSDVGNRYASVTEENTAPDATGHASDTRTLIPGCYNLTVTGTAKDDDGGTSAPLAIYSNSATSVYGRGFRPPIVDNERNIAKYGNVVPVKVVLTNTCTGGTVTNVSLYITLAKGVGNEAIEDTNVIAESVSAADSGSQMRTADGMYIFNLSTKNLSANGDWTIRVRLGSTAGPVLLQAVLYPKK